MRGGTNAKRLARGLPPLPPVRRASTDSKSAATFTGMKMYGVMRFDLQLPAGQAQVLRWNQHQQLRVSLQPPSLA
ncbi:uncharacterized protein EI90DRAFT_3047930 [Cantharellus anzutake]|uniref:uncharacterized protein n=1 Tax=Cantharellus anzutake TaxID=1750568 RepID=UPI0019038983|nr:uncharacterized protein EI90DRAFT_3096039 [Cantharellus anzutake]XP_038918549.1 uncharacterized protein EI90DRAFT_3047930 [Cantharellus anzutake]KAF8311664.1 hypothetical protein EI90DRAFT_3096039 [Cantharellus anzutake]KAF8335326.1 hypothetical protein EI90DRAFT_3047930 [Cantharellus anzutake]